MQAGLQMFVAVLRAARRLVWLGGELALAAARSERRALLGQRQATLSGPSDARRSWLHHLCRRLLRAFGIELHAKGALPRRGLLVANHLSYLDIIVLASLTPCVFVSKSEVNAWPVFGWFARRAGTLFVNRASRRDAVRAAQEILAALRSGALVVLFPEGTSSDGTKVLPFKSSLLESAVGAGVPVSVAALHYELADGDAAQEVCYWGGHTLLPHLCRLLSKRGVKSMVSFAPVGNTWRDRKKLAAQLHAEVAVLHRELQQGPLSEMAVEVKRLSRPAGRLGLFEQSLLTSAATKH